MCHRHVPLAAVLAACLLPCAAWAQPTGTLDPSLPIAARAPIQGRDGALSSAQLRELAALLFDPSLSSPLRASAWTATARVSQSTKEGAIQINLCDVAGCRGRSAIDLTLAGPIDKTEELNELADLDGLHGTARAELGGSHDILEVTGAPRFVGRVVVAHPKFSYRDRTTLAPSSESHPAGSATAGLVFKGVNRALTVDYRFERSYRASSSQQICTAATFGPPGTTTCSSLVVGGPSRGTKHVVEVEGAGSWAGTGAIRLRFAYDFHDRVAGVDAPIYVVPDAGGHLAGGMRLGFRTDTHAPTVSLFVGTFKL